MGITKADCQKTVSHESVIIRGIDKQEFVGGLK